MSSSPRLLYITDSHETGGAEHYLKRLAAHASERRGWNTTIAFDHTEGMEPLTDFMEGKGINGTRLPVSPQSNPLRGIKRKLILSKEKTPDLLDRNPDEFHVNPSTLKKVFDTVRNYPWELYTRFQLQQVLNDFKPDLVHFVLGWPTRQSGMVELSSRGFPTIATFQAVPPKERIEILPHVESFFSRSVDQDAVLICASNHNRKLVTQHFSFDESNVRVIHNGVNVDKFSRSESAQEQLSGIREEFNLSVDDKVVLTVSRINDGKDFSTLIKAAEDVIKQRDRMHFLIAGDGPDRPLVEAAINRRSLERNVHLLGYRKDVPKLLNLADLFVLPTHFEAFSFALHEALSSGLVCIASRTSCIPEFIAHGKNGWMYEPRDPKDLSDRIQSCIFEHSEEQKEQISREARKTAEKYTEEKMISRTFDTYDDLLKGGD